MKASKDIKREDGSRVRIEVEFHCEWHRNEFEYRTTIYLCGPRKRIFTPAVNSNSHEYRSVKFEERYKYQDEQNLKHASQEEINDVKLILWQAMKPCTS